MFPCDESQLPMHVDAPVPDDMEDLVDALASSMAKSSGKGVRQDVEQDQVRNATQEFVRELQEAIEHYELEDASDFARAIHYSADSASND